ncbi:MAG: ABC transporter ATP-binding protein/permease [Kiritimatiellales bacterium]|nr:ABC transporter ATP-binding protein/permease [Kiritimatiellales bacterium]
MLFYVFLFFGANIVLLLEPMVVGMILNTIQQINEIDNPLRELGMLFGMLIGIQFAFWAFHGPARVMENVVAFHAHNAYVDHLYHILTALQVQWHKDNHSGKTINRIRKSANALFNFMRNGYQGIEMVLKLVGSMAAVVILFPSAGIIALSICAVAFTTVFLFDRVLLPQYMELNEREHFVASASHDYITNIFTVISLRLEDLTRSELWRRMTCFFPLFRKNNVINETKWFIATIFIAMMTVAVLSWYAVSTLQAGGILLAGTVFMLYEYLQKIGGAFYTFAWKYSETVEQYADLKATENILNAVPDDRTEAKLPTDWKSVVIKNLTFSYEDDNHHQQHVDDISINLVRGRKIALVGASGSGKSTIMSLIRGLLVTDQGQVICDGVTMPEGLRILSHHVTLIPQEPEIFSNTIEYNVSVDTQQSESDILRDVESACFLSVLKRLPNRLKTDISEKGVNLSGGEKQRLALARGIFASRDSDIILMDEPTSSVDSMNELQIHRNIFERFSDRCIVASIHRLYLLPMFDYIYVMEDGKVIEEGSFDTLTKKDGTLKKMWDTYSEDASAVSFSPMDK